MNFFQTIINFFNLLWDFIINTIDIIDRAITIAYMSLNYVISLNYLLPAVIGSGCMIAIAVLIVRFLLLK